MFNEQCRISKTHGQTDACPCQILRKVLKFKRKNGKSGTFLDFFVQLERDIFKSSMFFRASLKVSFRVQVAAPSCGGKQKLFMPPILPATDIWRGSDDS